MYILALQQTKEGVYTALVKCAPKDIEIESLCLVPTVVNPLDILEGKKAKIVTGLEAKDLVRRQITLPLKKEKEILATLPFQTESLFPFQNKETILLPFLYPKENGTEAVLFATKKDFLSSHLQELEKKGIEPDFVSSTPAALARFCHFLFPDKTKIAFLHESSCICIEDKKIISAHFLQGGEETQEKMEAYIHTKFPDFTLTGNEGPSYASFDFPTLKKFAVPLGLALDFIQKEDGKSHQFLQGPFLPLSEKKLKKTILKAYGALSCLLTLCIWGIGSLVLQNHEKALHAKIDTYLEKQDPSASLEERLYDWEQVRSDMKKEYPLLPTHYSASEFLAWVGKLQGEITIQHLHYQLVKHPSPQDPLKPYVVKIDLSFKAASPEEARLFRERLQKERGFIQVSKEIEWSFSNERYKTSFFLKPKS